VQLTSPAFSRIHFQCYMLANGVSRPTFSAISHQHHAQIFVLKPYSLRSIIFFTISTLKYYQYSRDRHDCALFRDLLHNFDVLTCENIPTCLWSRQIIMGSGSDDWIYYRLLLQSLAITINYRAIANLPTSPILGHATSSQSSLVLSQ
jgi:hypothetical protein